MDNHNVDGKVKVLVIRLVIYESISTFIQFQVYIILLPPNDLPYPLKLTSTSDLQDSK